MPFPTIVLLTQRPSFEPHEVTISLLSINHETPSTSTLQQRRKNATPEKGVPKNLPSPGTDGHHRAPIRSVGRHGRLVGRGAGGEGWSWKNRLLVPKKHISMFPIHQPLSTARYPLSTAHCPQSTMHFSPFPATRPRLGLRSIYRRKRRRLGLFPGYRRLENGWRAFWQGSDSLLVPRPAARRNSAPRAV